MKWEGQNIWVILKIGHQKRRWGTGKMNEECRDNKRQVSCGKMMGLVSRSNHLTYSKGWGGKGLRKALKGGIRDHKKGR